MASHFFFFTIAVWFSCFATMCLSYDFVDVNPIRLVSDLLLDEPSFSGRVPIKAVYQFGDSISDTGNLLRSDPTTNCGNLPYGETFFDQPTGRCSDGLLVIDYFAKFLGLPLIDPYLNKDGNFTHGVNFAVASATALNVSILEDRYNIWAPTNLSLSVQLDWFKSHIKSLFPNATERKSELGKGLFLMGEVGGNDYNFAFTQGKSLPSVYKMVPDVIRVIRNTVEEIIRLGATQIIIPGNFPIGCVPMYLSMFETDDSTMYDEMKCLKDYNRHSEFHNDQLKQTIIELQKGHPNVTIVYMDYFGAVIEILQHASSLGFDEKSIQKACCGASDNEYKVNMNVYCGSDGVPVCENPREYVSWDGTHFTQEAYHVMAKKLMPSALLALQTTVAA